MKKTLTILLALLIFGVQQGIASEKRTEKIKPTRQTKLEKKAEMAQFENKLVEAIENYKAAEPMNNVAILEFLREQGYAPKMSDDNTVVFFKYQGSNIIVAADEELLMVATGANVKTLDIFNGRELTDAERAVVCRVCNDLSQNYRCVKSVCYDNSESMMAVVEVMAQDMSTVKRYLEHYVSLVDLITSKEFPDMMHKYLSK